MKDLIPPDKHHQSCSLALSELLLMTKVQTAGWLVGAPLIAASIVAPPHGSRDNVLWVLVGLAAVFGLGLRLAPASLLLNKISIYSSIPVIGVVIALSEPAGMGRLLYLWPLMSAAQFLGRRDLIATMGLLAATLVPALHVAKPPSAELMYVLTMIALGVVAVLQHVAVQQLRRTMRKLELVAITDSLTELLDRRGFLAAIERDLERARRSDLPVTLVQFDLDRFKAINDNFGHAAGDDVLVGFSQVLETECRGTDVAARIGGEEFAVLLFNADAASGRGFAERVAVALESFVAPGGVPLTVSAGVVVANRYARAEQLLWAADGAVYEAKASGRDQIVVVPSAQRPLIAF